MRPRAHGDMHLRMRAPYGVWVHRTRPLPCSGGSGVAGALAVALVVCAGGPSLIAHVMAGRPLGEVVAHVDTAQVRAWGIVM